MALRLNGFAPSTSQLSPGVSITEPVPSGLLTLTALAPKVGVLLRHSVPNGSLVLNGVAPKQTQKQAHKPTIGALMLTGVAPTTRQIGTIVESIPLSQLRLVSFAPRTSGGVTIAPRRAGGRASKQRPRIVTIGGQRFAVYSPQGLRYILSKYLREQELELRQVENQAPKSRQVIRLKSNITRTEKRIAEVDRRWQIQQENELLILLLAS